MEKNTVVELFAGVGGFRLGLETSGWKNHLRKPMGTRTKKTMGI